MNSSIQFSIAARRRSRPAECAICGMPRVVAATWFLITEDSRTDTLAVWKWSDELSGRNEVRAVCGERHARELIVHWITTGSLQYPFATISTPTASSHHCSIRTTTRAAGEQTCLGELAIDRNEIVRVLTENPLSLGSMLDELMIVLAEQSGSCEELQAEEPAAILD